VVTYTESLVPPRYRLRVFDMLKKVNFQLRGFLRGQLLVCLCMGIIYAFGLYFSGTPFGILVGFFGGMASFVPYLGITLTIMPSVILTVLQHGVDGHVLAVLAVFAVAHAIEAYILTPKIVGTHVGLNPVWVILAILVFTSLLGFVGLLIAVPTAAVLKVVVVEAIIYYRKSALFSETEEDASSSGPAV
jgi:predicted PurR-regulated permease PerM